MNNDDLLRQTEEYLQQQIPLVAAMGVRLESYEAERLVLTAPLDRNHNHLGTAFGGSLSAAATLAGYAWLWLELREPGCHLVIRESHLSFRRPVRKSIRAVCHRPPPEAWSGFASAFREKGKARIELRVTIEEDERIAVEFTGTFVALR
jgi:thioesterase domain-containing protein